MVTTRSKSKGESHEDIVADAPSQLQQKPKKANTSRKRKSVPTKETSTTTPAADRAKKRKDSAASDTHQQHSTSTTTTTTKETHHPPTSSLSEKVNNLIDTYGAGSLPLHDAGLLPAPTEPSSATVLAHVFNALLSSSRISHDIAARSVRLLVQAGYHDLPTLSASTWQQRADVLTKGGYAHYREKTATELGELAALIEDKYKGDASGLLPGDDVSAGRAGKVAVLKRRLKEIKGLGDVGADIFVAEIQEVWPGLAPVLDRRSLKTAEEVGLGKDVEGLFECVGRDATRMARLNKALTTIRLEKRVGEFKE
ncbi:uncharacterized protein LTHEOB_1198 [Lasiodiplodia theobromae]|uniref:uncharacterized protein n=1 Tax=Lasiodiplodia theobromae TaxID=45133 RepID=UPI0015C364AD|nr:uncharacterized protein LTHEOB_1198 [Lasiodiplodia theobromae]KAF4538844.1 hypothetical protein LTHEOB_1198 [Lasiodiplodia theobromae]